MPVGKPFEPGDSRQNRGGRPKGIARRVREIVGEDGDSIALFWGAVMSGELRTVQTVVNDAGEKTGEKIVYEKVSVSDRLAASKFLAERGWGKPPEYAPIEDENPLDMVAEAGETMADALERRLDEVAAQRAKRDARTAAPTAASG
jgi:hypothetical protein